MRGVFSKVCGIGLLLSSVIVVQLQAQRGGSGGHTPAERHSNAAQGATGAQPAGTAAGQPGTPATAQPSPNFFPGRNSTFTPSQPAAAPATGQFGVNPASINSAAVQPPGSPANTAAGMPARQPVQPPASKPQVSAATVAAPPPGMPFVGPPLPPPPVALTPEKQPPTPPRITFQNGMLTLESTNSRLSDVLNGVRTKANIQFEGLDSAPERVAVKLGPAPADEVLSSLLQGSRFDYVILGQPENPHAVEKVMLTAKTAAAPGMAMASVPPAKQTPDEVAEEGEATEEQTVEQPQPVPTAVQPMADANPGAQNPGVPTPEQLLEKINKLKEEQQKQGNVAVPTGTAPVKRPLLPQ